MKLGHLINHGSMALSGSREKCHGIYLRCCIAGSIAWTTYPFVKHCTVLRLMNLINIIRSCSGGHCHEAGSEVERSCEGLIFAVYFAFKNVSQLPSLVSRASPDRWWPKKFDKYIFYPLSWQGVGTRVTNSRDRSVHSAILGSARSVNRAAIRILKLQVWRSGWHTSSG